MAVKYVKDFDFSKGTAACNYAKGGAAKKPAGMMIVIGVGKSKGPMKKSEGGSVSDSDRRMMEQMAGDANAYTEAQRMMGQGAVSDTEARAMRAAVAKKKPAPAAKKGSPYIPGTNVKAGDLYTKEELERLERGYKKGGKVAKVMHEFGEGKLHSGSKEGPKVTSRKQAVAIALSEAGKMKKAKGGKVSHMEWEHSKEDLKQDKKLAKMHGMSLEAWEKSKMDEKHDKQQSMKGFAKGGMAQKVQMAKSNAVKASLKGQKKTGYADGGMAMGSMGKANPYAMGPGGRQYEASMDSMANRMPVPQRGATTPMPAPQRGALMRSAPPPMPIPQRGAPVRPAPAPPAPMMGGRGKALPPGPPAPPMRRAEGGMASIKSPLQRMSRAKGVPVASEMPMIESKSSGPKSIGVNAKRPGGPNVGAIRAAMARAASKAVPENAPSMMKKGGKVK